MHVAPFVLRDSVSVINCLTTSKYSSVQSAQPLLQIPRPWIELDDPIELAIVEKKFEVDISFLITHVNLTFLYKPAFYRCKAILCAFASNEPNSDNLVLRLPGSRIGHGFWQLDMPLVCYSSSGLLTANCWMIKWTTYLFLSNSCENLHAVSIIMCIVCHLVAKDVLIKCSVSNQQTTLIRYFVFHKIYLLPTANHTQERVVTMEHTLNLSWLQSIEWVWDARNKREQNP